MSFEGCPPCAMGLPEPPTRQGTHWPSGTVLPPRGLPQGVTA